MVVLAMIIIGITHFTPHITTIILIITTTFTAPGDIDIITLIDIMVLTTHTIMITMDIMDITEVIILLITDITVTITIIHTVTIEDMIVMEKGILTTRAPEGTPTQIHHYRAEEVAQQTQTKEVSILQQGDLPKVIRTEIIQLKDNLQDLDLTVLCNEVQLP